MEPLKRVYKEVIRILVPIGLATVSIVLTISVANANPVLGNVAAGNVSIQQAPNSTVVNQSSQKAIINWQSFNIGSQESTHFQQPTGGMALNRISATQGVSQIYGKLTATGHIILVNPAGIFFGPSAYVNVGGIIATTANITDNDFMNGNYTFNEVSPNDGEIVNQGKIIAEDHGLVALMGNGVENNGTIQANLGTVAIGSGQSYTVTFNGDDNIGFAVSGNAKHGITNTGVIRANGGKVMITANVAAGVLDHVINLGGLVEAHSVGTRRGDIVIDGGDNGTVYISGKIHATSRHSTGGQILIKGNQILVDSTADIDASGATGGGQIFIGGSSQGKGPIPNAKVVTVASNATINANATASGNGGSVVIYADNSTTVNGNISVRGGAAAGNGGYVETSSGGTLNLDGIKVDTSAAVGAFGTWLLDPYNVIISTNPTNNVNLSSNTYSPSFPGANINNTDLSNNLGSTNITVTTGTLGGENGDITVAAYSPISWTAATTLLLQAAGNIIINSPITATNGTLQLIAANTPQSITTDPVNGTINVKNFNLEQGQWYQVASLLPAFTVTNDFEINSGSLPAAAAQFIRATSGDGSSGNPFVIADVFGLQGIASSAATLADNYLLGNNIDATVTSNWNGGTGFEPIGTDSFNQGFTGNFNGQNYLVSNLTINRPNGIGQGLFGFVNDHTSNGVISNIGVNGSVTANEYVGLLAGLVSYGTINNAFSTGSVNSSQPSLSIGGLIGEADFSTLSQIYSTANVNVSSSVSSAGGLIGVNGNGNITNAYSTGNVAVGASSFYVGGLVGQAAGQDITNVYSTGHVSAGGNSDYVGGLIGFNSATLTSSYWNTDTSGQSNGCGNGSCSATGESTLNLYQQSTFTPGFAFYTPSTPSNVWYMAGYPHLTFENTSTITNVIQLQLMAVNLSGHYTLANNIDATDTEHWNGGAGFMPIGDSTNAFTGILNTLNNQELLISNLTINLPTSSNVGLFGYANGAKVNNIGVNGSVTGLNYVGSLAGFITNNTSLSNDYSSGRVNAPKNGAEIGGLIGGTSDGTVSTITNVYNSAAITVGNDAQNIGGLIGSNQNATVTNAYNSGSITVGNSVSYIGGLIGINSSNITNTYNSGHITEGTNPNLVGGLIGNSNGGTGTIANSFWDTNTSGISDTTKGCGDISSCSGVTGDPTNTLYQQSTYTTFLFYPTTNGVWYMAGYPHFTYENTPTITNVIQLQLMNINLAGNYTLANNIDASDTANWNGGAGFTPIGDVATNFTGSLNGQNNTINNLYINQPSGLNSDIGLFGDVNSPATISNIGVANAAITVNYNNTGSDINAGLLIGKNIGGTVANAYTTGSLTFGSSGTPSNVDHRLGGLIGWNEGTLSDVYNLANIIVYSTGSGFSNIGGLVGLHNGGGNIDSAYNAGSISVNLTSVSGSQSIGGLAGELTSNSITNSYNNAPVSVTGSASGAVSVGGLVGSEDFGSPVTPLINNTYNAGLITNSAGGNTGGLIGSQSAGSASNSFWDINTSGISDTSQGCGNTPNCTGVTGDPTTTLYTQSTFPTFSFYDPNTNPGGIWYMAGYPHFTFENTPTITNVVQLQLMNINLAGSYTLANNIDASDTSRWNGGAGFTPVGSAAAPFTGSFNGNNDTISNLYINLPTSTDVGLFGDTNHSSVISNLSLIANVTGNINVGALIGDIAGTISNITNNSIVVGANAASNIGGLIGISESGSALSNLTNAGTVTVSGNGASNIGGIAGSIAGSVSSVYNGGNITAGTNASNVGGIGGTLNSTISNVYNTGNVTVDAGSTNIGGLFGTSNGTINTSYSSGAVIARGSSTIGGFVGDNLGTITNSFWDTDTSLQSTGANGGTQTNLTGGCFSGTCTNGGTANLSALTTYSNAPYSWSIGNTDPINTFTWLIFNGQTRPMLEMEYNTTISTAHQLQLIGVTPTTLAATYTLANNIDLSGTTNPSDVWGTSLTNGGAGFVPIGQTSAYTGNLYGNSNTVSDLYINQPSATSNVGLFANTSTGDIFNIVLTNANVIANTTSGVNIGILVGSSTNSEIIELASVTNSNLFSSGNGTIGGLIGNFAGRLITQSFAFNNNIIATNTNSNKIGGFIGSNSSNIEDSYSSGMITTSGTGPEVGGFVGNNSSVVDASGSDTNITNTASNLASIGGFAGNNINTITSSYSLGNITDSPGSSAINLIGGFVGTNSGSITNAYSIGSVTENGTLNDVGGFAGYLGGGTITNAYSTGLVTANSITNPGVAGFVGVNKGTITNSFWDTDTSEQSIGTNNGGTVTNLTGGCFSGSPCTNGGTATLSALSTYQNAPYSWNIGTDFSNTWLIFDGQTRPMLTTEFTSNIYTAHQLQLIGINSDSLSIPSYTLANNIDLSGTTNPADVWGTSLTNGGAGFAPIGQTTTFTGGLNGQNNTISNLYINLPGTNSNVGLFANTSTGIIENIGITNATVIGSTAGNNKNGILIGSASNPLITNVSVSNSSITAGPGASGDVGGLIGQFTGGTLSNSSAVNNNVTATNENDATGGLGGFVGQNIGTILNSYNSGTVTLTGGSANAGGFVGGNSGTISNSMNVANFTNNSTLFDYLGGFAGFSDGTINTSYNAGTVTDNGGNVNNLIGGFIGNNSGTINNSYNIGTVVENVTGSIGVGGFAGYGGNITNSYSSGLVQAESGNIIGGFNAYSTGTITNSFWDTQTSGQSTSSSGTGETTVRLLTASTYSGAGWNIGTDPTTNTWVIFDGQTRPMLAMEYNTTISTPHQLQLIGLNAITLKANYTLANNIDLNQAMNNLADVWATNQGGSIGVGFIPIAQNSTFTGSFNGNSNTISNLYINQPTTTLNVGLFANTDLGTIQNVTVNNATVIGGNANTGSVGILIGSAANPLITNVTVSNSSLSANQGNNGGLIGLFSGSLISNSSSLNNNISTINLVVGNDVGGLVGQNTGDITNSSSSGTLTTAGNGPYIGGLVGQNSAFITNSTNATNINNTAFNQTWLGGLVGFNSSNGTINTSYNMGNITDSPGPSAVNSVGGLVGDNNGIVSDAYSIGPVTENGTGNFVGGLIGTNISNLIFNTYSSGAVIATSNNTVGGLAGTNSGTINNSFWDTQTSGQSNSAGGTGQTTSQLLSESTYSGAGWNIGTAPSVNTWVILDGQTRPMLGMEYNTTITNAHQLQLVELNLSASYTLANNIDASGTSNAADIWGTSLTNGSAGFVPIGNLTNVTPFVGRFNGNSFNISNLYINSGSTNGVGLFGYAQNATISNVGVNGMITGDQYVGLLAGFTANTTIQNVASTGSVNAPTSGSKSVGGLIGEADTGSLTNAYNAANVTAGNNAQAVGGLIGFNDTNLTNAYNIGSVTAGTGAAWVGGFVGQTAATLTDAYSSGAVTAGTGSTDVGGFAGNSNILGTITGSFWDTTTSGISDTTQGCGNTPSCAGVTGLPTATLMLLTTYQSAGWDITATPSTTATAPSNAWFIFDGGTRPMLMMENTTNISNAHELQMMGAALGASYTLANNIDLTNNMNNTADVWGTNKSTSTGLGFVPIGTFTGTLAGNNDTISNLYINQTSPTTDIGLFSDLTNAAISHLNLSNSTINITGNNYINQGTLAGNAANSIATYINVTNGMMNAGSGNIGGLIGNSSNNSSLYNTTSNVNINVNPGTNGSNVGGLVGNNSAAVTYSNSSGNIDLVSSPTIINAIGGFAGLNTGSIQNSYNLANVTNTAANNSNKIGGFVGSNQNIITSSYNAGNVTDNSVNTSYTANVGGFAGQNGGSISNSYSIGTMIENAPGASNVGGFVGANLGAGSLANVYSSGIVQGTSGNTIGGLTGLDVGTTTNSFWDTDSSLQATSASGTGETTANMMTAATFSGAGWNIGTNPASNIWVIFDGQTRPLLGMEYSTTLTNAHQLQLAGLNLSVSYTLANNIDASGTSNAADIWGTSLTNNGAGFVPIAQTSTFTGNFNGNGNTISNLYINLPATTNNVGLFANTSTGTIQNMNINNATIIASNTSADSAGILIGTASNPLISNVSVSDSSLTANDGANVGGVIGKFSGSLLTNSLALNNNIVSSGLTSFQNIGGFIGLNQGTITNSYSSGTMTVTGGGIANLGGFVGNNKNIISNSGNGTNITSSAGNNTFVGGLVGWNQGTINTSYNTGNVVDSPGASANNFIGGLAGENDSNIYNSYSIGSVTENGTGNQVGGLVGGNTNSISNTYSSGLVTAAANNAVGGLSANNFGSITGSFWDTQTSGQSTSAGGTGQTTAQLLNAATYTAAGWNIGTDPYTNTWVIFNGQTRPMLGSEYGTTIYTAHQLQLIGINSTTLAANYTLDGNVDLSGTTNPADVWGTSLANGGDGFVPIAQNSTFTGSFNGQNNTISNLYINLPGTNSNVGLFANTSTGTIENVTIANADVIGSDASLVSNGILIGSGYNPLITNVSISNSSLTAGAGNIGGLIGDFSGMQLEDANTSNTTVTGDNTSYAIFLGNFAGINSGTITNAYSSGTAVFTGSSGSGIERLGGLVGYNTGTITNSANFANVTNSSSAYVTIGGFIGFNNGTINTSYNAGTVLDMGGNVNNLIGGFAGVSNIINNSYNIGTVIETVTGGFGLGGFAGYSGNVTDSYSSGLVEAMNGNIVGGFSAYATGTLSNDFWDTDTSGQSIGVPGGAAGVTGGCFSGSCTNSGTATLSALSTYTNAGWSITATPSSTAIAPNYSWFIFNNETRPMLMMENTNSIANAHQLQMMGAALGGNYTIANNIDLTNAMNNAADVWGTNEGANTGSGFVPIGNNTNNFTGTLNGGSNTILNLYLNQTAAVNDIGLFGDINNATISNLALDTATINVTSDNNINEAILAGSANNSMISNIQISNSVITGGSGNIGGLVGTFSGTGILSNSSTNANISVNTGAAYSSNIGGLVGVNYATIRNSYTMGTVSLLNSSLNDNIGGFAGQNNGTIQASFNQANLTNSSASNANLMGGFVGDNESVITTSYNLGNVTDNSSNANNIGYAAGFAGQNAGSIYDSYSMGNVIEKAPGASSVGGFAAQNAGSLTNVYSAGAVIGNTSLGNIVGGLTAFSGGSTTNGFWDMDSSGQNTSASGAGESHLYMMKQSTFTGFDFNSIWGIIDGKSYPYLRAFYLDTPRTISGDSPANVNDIMKLAVNGANFDSIYVNANGYYYFLEGNNVISNINHTIADNSLLLTYISGSVEKASAITFAPTANGSINDLNMTNNTVTAGQSNTSAALNNTNLINAKGSLTDSDILYSGTSPNLVIADGYNLLTPLPTSYSINGNITATNGTMTFNGPVFITAANPTLQTNVTGDVVVTNTVDMGGNSLTVDTVGTNSSISGNIVDAIGSNLTKDGTGTLTLSGSNAYTGLTDVNAGILSIAYKNALGFGGNNTSTVNVASGATLDLDNVTIAPVIPLNLNGTGVASNGALTAEGTSSYTGNVTLQSNSSINSSGILTLSGVISGPSSLTSIGSGTLVLSNSGNDYTGVTTINAGILQLGATNAVPAVSDVTVLSGATFDLNNYNDTIHSLAGAGDVTLGSATLTSNGNKDTTFSGIISGTPGVLVQDGTSTFILSGNNTYGGGTFINNGILSADNDNALGTGNVTVHNGGTLELINNRTIDNTMTLSGNGYVGANPTGAILATGRNILNGNITLSGNTLIYIANGSTTLNGLLNGANALTINGSSANIILNNLIGNTQPLTALTVNVPVTINTSAIKTSNKQIYNDFVTLQQNVNLSLIGSGNDAITIANGISGLYNMSLNGDNGNDTFNVLGSIALNDLNMTGGGGNNAFNIIGSLAINNIAVIGNNNINTLQISTGNTQNWTLTGANTGNALIPGVVNPVTITFIQNLIGGSGNDFFSLSGGTLSGSINGAGGINTLTADNVPDTWHIYKTNAGIVTGINGFSHIQNLNGGDQGDNFLFSNNSRITGFINAGVLTQINRLDYQAYTTPITVYLPQLNSGNTLNNSFATISNFADVNHVIGDMTLARFNYLSLPGTFGVVFTAPGTGYVIGQTPMFFTNFSLTNPLSPISPIIQQGSLITFNPQNPITRWLDSTSSIQIDITSIMQQEDSETANLLIKQICPAGANQSTECTLLLLKLSSQ